MNTLENQIENSNELGLAYSITQQVGIIRLQYSKVDIFELLKFNGPVNIKICEKKLLICDNNMHSLFAVSTVSEDNDFNIFFLYSVALAINNVLFRHDDVTCCTEDSENEQGYKKIEINRDIQTLTQVVKKYSHPFHTQYTNGGGYIFDKFGKVILSACITPEFKELSTPIRLARSTCVAECINQYWFNDPIYWEKI